MRGHLIPMTVKSQFLNLSGISASPVLLDLQGLKQFRGDMSLKQLFAVLNKVPESRDLAGTLRTK